MRVCEAWNCTKVLPAMTPGGYRTKRTTRFCSSRCAEVQRKYRAWQERGNKREPWEHECPKCGYGWAWVEAEGPRRLVLQCWSCEARYYLETTPNWRGALTTPSQAWEHVEQVVEAYADGATLRQLARRFKCSDRTVRRILESCGVERRGRPTTVDPEARRRGVEATKERGRRTAERVIALRQQGLTFVQIGAELGLNAQWVGVVYNAHARGVDSAA